jgi:stringent starvation protein B
MTVQQTQPSKKDVTLALMQKSSVFLHIDPRREEVVVPPQFKGRPHLVLQVGLNMAVRIPDLEVEDDAISCTLSFNRTPCWCRLPWHSIFAVVAEDERGMVWQDDVPHEVAFRFGVQPSPPPRPVPVPAPAEAATPAPALAIAPSGAEITREESTGRKTPTPKKKKGTKKPVEAVATAVKSVDSETAPESTPPSKPKRELPPYLRVIK